MTFTSEKKTTIFYILAATLLVTVLVFFYFNNQKVKETSDLVEHTQDILHMSDAVLLDVLNIETSARGYLLSGNETFLVPYKEGVTKIDTNLALLTALTKDNANQQERIVLLKHMVSERLVLTKNIIEAKKQNELTETDKIKIIEQGKILSDKIRTNIAKINTEEFSLLKQRKKDNDTSYKNADLLFLWLLIFLMAIVALVIIIIRNQTLRNQELEAFNTEQKYTEHALIEAKISAESAQEIAEVAKTKAENATILAEDATKRAEDSTKKAEDATKIAEEAVKAKQQFLSNMSHEIRTPMNAIIGFTKVVLKTDLSAKQQEYLNAIKISGDTLIVLINDILDLAKVDAGKMTFENTPFKMAAAISAMLHLFETKIEEKNLILVKEYDATIPEVLLGDSVRLHQIILNLVGNAVKFTEKGQITVSVSMIGETTNRVTLEFAVKDTGIGIMGSKMSTVFESFQQASSETARLFGGTGLGLAIVKQLVEAQGGTIAVKSTLADVPSGTHGGSVFSVILDFEKTQAVVEVPTETLEGATDVKNIKILVVEDMKLNQLLMRTILDDFGFEYDMADNGQIALDKLKKTPYDIILMDLQMPEMNGFEATDYIRNTLKLTLPIIALTADVTTVDVEKCRTVGMDDYVSKPLDERILYAKIMGLVKIKQY